MDNTPSQEPVFVTPLGTPLVTPLKKQTLLADLQPAVSKYCNKCRAEHPISDFDLHPRTRDGLKTACRACVRAYNKNRYAANRERMKRQAMDWQKNNINKTARYKNTYYKKSKIKNLLNEPVETSPAPDITPAIDPTS